MVEAVKSPGSIRSLWRCERGAVIVYFAITFAVVIGMGGLVVDLGRLYTTGEELQNAAAALALAGGAELDGEVDAITRANLAVLGDGGSSPLVANTDTFSTNTVVTVSTIRFLHSLPPDDDPIDVSFETTDPAEARFIEVTVTPGSIVNFFLPLVGFSQTSTANAYAVAGFKQVICQFPPLMICNPYELPGGGGPFEPITGQMVRLKAVGEGTQWGPGDFGLLVTPEGGVGLRDIREELASASASGCFQTNVDIRPGEAVALRVGLNVRFDIYDPPFNTPKYKNDPEYRSAKNVTKGMVRNPSNACQYSEPTQTPPEALGLPRDECFYDDPVTCVDGRFGTFDDTDRFSGMAPARLMEYWRLNHDPSIASADDLTNGAIGNSLDFNGDGKITRFDIYEWEIENWIPDNSAIGGEDGNAMCSTVVPPAPDPWRRVLVTAVINCIENNIKGQQDDVPVVAFMKFFLPEPIRGANDNDLFIEMIEKVDPGLFDTVLHDMVQLYRIGP